MSHRMTMPAAESSAGVPSLAPREATSAPAPLIRLCSISKSFPGVRALEGVTLSLHHGEVLGIVGENGAGKSTLLKILGGILQPDDGEIWIDGSPRALRGVRDAIHCGIGLIHQELNLAPALNVAENMFLGRQPSRGAWLGITHRRKLYAQAELELKRLGLNVPPTAPLQRLGIAQRQLIEVAKALATNARVLIFDEPTSSLSLSEADRLLRIILELRGRGAVIYVSHRLEEIKRIADRVVVLRDGRQSGSLSKAEISRDGMISLMVGRDLAPVSRSAPERSQKAAALEVRSLKLSVRSPAISFQIHPGEIVGLAGIIGAGRTELAQAIFGVVRPVDGQILVHGEPVRITNPTEAIAAGLAFVPEDRKALGVIVDQPIGANVSLSVLRRLARCYLYNRRGERELANSYRQLLGIRCHGVDQRVGTLSGGNQQKVALAKALATRPQVIILDEPTRGVDIGAKQEIYRHISEMASQGMAVMMVSSDMEEVISLSDRVLVMQQGRIAGELSGPDITEERIMQLAVHGPADAKES